MDYGESGTHYKRILIEGVVQGVGFRPFVYRTAVSCGISGRVANINGHVEIIAGGSPENIGHFIGDLRGNAPVMAQIESITVSDADVFSLGAFLIEESKTIGGTAGLQPLNIHITPDLPVCADCLDEIHDKNNRRYGHFFNSCVNCGPRFSIMEKLPYDRCNTSMRHFPLCPDCAAEYTAPEDRRFHAETVCCHHCGPVLTYTQNGRLSTGQTAFDAAVSDLRNGCVLAIKGVGGYHLACSPFDGQAVGALRVMKNRAHKPFAVMFKNLSHIRQYCHVSDDEEALLTSVMRPIVLLETRGDIFTQSVLWDSHQCGCFLPYTALHHLLLEQLDFLVLTSANISGDPIMTEDTEPLIFEEKHPLFAGVLSNNRPIVRGEDDSVAHMNAGIPQIIRAARGIAPKSFPLATGHNHDFLAVGSDLKASFCYVKNGRAYMSQYFGDLDNAAVYERYKKEIENYASLLDARPKFVVCDAHPAYSSTLYAESLGLPVYKIQHHFAHAASVLAERGIHKKVLAVCFDGLGYGNDGHLWGGEFLLCDRQHYTRAGHLSYTKLLGMDSAAKDAKKTALCYLLKAGAGDAEDFDMRASLVKAALDADMNTFFTSSAGRLFDAVSAVLGLCGENEYEGQCAAALQKAAEQAIKNHMPPLKLTFDINTENGLLLPDPAEIFNMLYQKNINVQAAALGFHHALADATAEVCARIAEQTRISEVILSGGVFQNRLLVTLTAQRLREKGLTMLINQNAPPNDGGIALGQAYVGGLLCV